MWMAMYVHTYTSHTDGKKEGREEWGRERGKESGGRRKFSGIGTFALLGFILHIAFDLLGISALFLFPESLICSHYSPAQHLSTVEGWLQKYAEKKINNLQKGFLISLGFMNFGSIIQKLEFLTMRREPLIDFLLPQVLQRHIVFCRHLHFILNSKYVWIEQIFIFIWSICYMKY